MIMLASGAVDRCHVQEMLSEAFAKQCKEEGLPWNRWLQ